MITALFVPFKDNSIRVAFSTWKAIYSLKSLSSDGFVTFDIIERRASVFDRKSIFFSLEAFRGYVIKSLRVKLSDSLGISSGKQLWCPFSNSLKTIATKSGN